MHQKPVRDHITAVSVGTAPSHNLHLNQRIKIVYLAIGITWAWTIPEIALLYWYINLAMTNIQRWKFKLNWPPNHLCKWMNTQNLSRWNKAVHQRKWKIHHCSTSIFSSSHIRCNFQRKWCEHWIYGPSCKIKVTTFKTFSH